MTRLLISIFSPRFITTTTALGCDLPRLEHFYHKETDGEPISLDLLWLLRLETSLESEEWTNIHRWSELIFHFPIEKAGPKPKKSFLVITFADIYHPNHRARQYTLTLRHFSVSPRLTKTTTSSLSLVAHRLVKDAETLLWLLGAGSGYRLAYLFFASSKKVWEWYQD